MFKTGQFSFRGQPTWLLSIAAFLTCGLSLMAQNTAGSITGVVQAQGADT